MKRKPLVALSLALLMVLSGLSGSLAYADQGPVSGSEVGTEEVQKTVENDQALLSEPGEEEAEKKDLEISPETVAQPVRAGEKTFTLTKRSGETITTVGSYDKFYDAVNAMDVNDASSFFYNLCE